MAAGGYVSANAGADGGFEVLIHAGVDRQVLQLESPADSGYALSGTASFVLDVVADRLLLSGPADIREGVPYDIDFMPLNAQGSLDRDLLPTVVDSSGALAFRAGIAAPSALLILPVSALSANTSETASGEFALSVAPTATATGTVRFTLQLPGDVDIAVATSTMLTIGYAGLFDVLMPRAKLPVLLNVDGEGQDFSVSDALLIARVLTLSDETLDTDPSRVIEGFDDLDEDDARQIIADVRREIERNPDLLDVSGDAVVDESDGAYLTTYLGIDESLRERFANFVMRRSYQLSIDEADAAIAKIETLIATVVE